ncbi:hypothetical protein WJX73_007285 [Symbiochloris irregularis]|uniref:F-box domain-containing protein n=1 Tax=Symbiochloris irregularis TaxID=706552 RepID=A0AAW1P190_9CHLO
MRPLSLPQYERFGISQALLRQGDFVRATEELAFFVRELYEAASKQAQTQMFEDVCACIQHCSGSAEHQKVLQKLLQEINATFRANRRKKVTRRYTAAQVDLQRSKQRAAAQQAAEGSACPPWSELPDEVLLKKIFGCLDATSLVMAACTQRDWRQLARDDSLWSALLRQDFGRTHPASLSHPGTSLERYRDLAEQRPNWFSNNNWRGRGCPPWVASPRCCYRAMQNGLPIWRHWLDALPPGPSCEVPSICQVLNSVLEPEEDLDSSSLDSLSELDGEDGDIFVLPGEEAALDHDEEPGH